MDPNAGKPKEPLPPQPPQPPLPGSTPPKPPPLGKKGNLGLLIGLLVAGLVVLIAVAGALFLILGSDDDSGSSSDPVEISDDSSGNESLEAAEESAGSELDERPTVEVPSEPAPDTLEVEDIVVGDGAEAKPGDTLTVNYVSALYSSGEEFDASWDRGEPFEFTLGADQVISGWDEGLAGMKVGGRRELVIPPTMAYGEVGSPPTIPPDSTLVYIVDLIAVN